MKEDWLAIQPLYYECMRLLVLQDLVNGVALGVLLLARGLAFGDFVDAYDSHIESSSLRYVLFFNFSLQNFAPSIQTLLLPFPFLLLVRLLWPNLSIV